MNSSKAPSRLKQVSRQVITTGDMPSAQPVAAARSFGALLQKLQLGWHWLQVNSKVRMQTKSRRLRVSETVSLGEKRFVSIVEVDGTSFLIGGGSGNVSLLTQLADLKASHPFEQAVADAWQRESA